MLLDYTKFLQVVILESDGKQSGGEIRNEANYANLEDHCIPHVVSLARCSPVDGDVAHPTIAPLNQEQINALCGAIERLSPHGVIFEGVCLLQAIRLVRSRFPQLKIIVDFHNVESQLYKGRRTQQLPKILRWFVKIPYGRSIALASEADYEVDRLADEIWCCSERDAEIGRAIGLAKITHVIPNPIPYWCFDTAVKRSAKSRELLFLGHLGYRPNILAVKRLCKKILPRVQRKIPEMQLHVCGRSPSRRVLRIASETKTRLTADPAALGDIYSEAAVTAIPLTVGGGTRIKVLEAMAVGCPIVASRKAVEGLNVVPGEHFVLAETNSEFAEAISRTVLQPDFAAEIAKNAREYCLASYNNTARSRLMRAALNATMEAPQSFTSTNLSLHAG